jgi:hypothetical protein
MKSIVTLVIKKVFVAEIFIKTKRNNQILRTNLDFSSIRVRVPPPLPSPPCEAAAAPSVVMLAAFTTTASEANLSSCWLSHFPFVTITYVVAVFVGVAVFCLSNLDCNDAAMIPNFSKEF